MNYLYNGVEMDIEFADNISECVDTSKLYVLPDGYLYAYIQVTTNLGDGTNLADRSSPDWLTDQRMSMNSSIWNCVGAVVTNYIPGSEGDVIRVKALDMVNEMTNYYNTPKSGCYDAAKNELFVNVASGGNVYWTYALEDDVAVITITHPDVAYMRFCGEPYDGYTAADIVITRNEKEVITEYQWTNTGLVYEPPKSTTNSQILMMGWLVGKKIAAIRIGIVGIEDTEPVVINPNLAPLSKMSVWNEKTYEQNGFEWIIPKNTINSGLRFEPNELTVGETYTISYWIQKRSGMFKTIRGHCKEGWEQIKWSIDGVQQTDSYASNEPTAIVADDDTPHFVEFTGIYKATGSQNGFFVQANRMQNESVTVAIWNFKVELGDTATPWIPAEEDVLT